MRKAVIFSGNQVSESTKKTLKRKINQFLKKEFEVFRDRAEMEEIHPCRVGYATMSFGDEHQYYDIRASISEEGDVEFEITDEERDDVIVFMTTRLMGKLEEVYVAHDNITYINKVLNLLNQASWVY